MKNLILIILLIFSSLALESKEKESKFQVACKGGWITDENQNLRYSLKGENQDKYFYDISLKKGIYVYYTLKGEDSVTFVVIYDTIYKLGITGSKEDQLFQQLNTK